MDTASPEVAEIVIPKDIPERVLPKYKERQGRQQPGSFSGSADLRREAIRLKWQQGANKGRQQYVFQPLDPGYTRLLIIHPANDASEDLLIVTLKAVKFEELGTNIKFEALSYVWGKEEADYVVNVREDHTTLSKISQTNKMGFQDVVKAALGRYFLVKPNLFFALQRLRKIDRPVTLWVDALCMDQKKLEERKEQVSRMAEIYSRANRVLIWLGEGDIRTQNAISLAAKIVAEKPQENLFNGALAARAWSDMVYLMHCPWFSRRWVIQELALASDATVHCGKDQIHWVDLRDAIFFFMEKFKDIRDSFRQHNFMDDYEALSEPGVLAPKLLVDTANNLLRRLPTRPGAVHFEPVYSIEYLVCHLSTFQTSDGRDTIYALRNICKEKDSEKEEDKKVLQPDYSKNLLEVYVTFVRWVVQTTRKSDIICRPWAIPERTERGENYPELVKLPTWVRTIDDAAFGSRDRTHRSRIHADSLVAISNGNAYNASHGRDADVEIGFGLLPETSKPGISTPQRRASLLVERRTGPLAVRPATRSTTGTPAPDTIPSRRENISITVPPTGVAKRKAKEQKNSNGRQKRPKRTKTADTIVDDIPYSSGIDGASYAPRDIRHGAFMEISGLHVGTVTWLTDPIPDGVVPEKALRQIRGRLNRNNINDLTRIVDKLWRILCAERGADGMAPPPSFERACRSCLLNDTPNGHLNIKNLLEKSDLEESTRNFLERARAVIWNRRFLQIRSDSNTPENSLPPSEEVSPVESKPSPQPDPEPYPYHGLGPSKARRGDHVCILFGCSVPVLLRPTNPDAADTHYTLVGEAYVYGLMEGEALFRMPEEDIEDQQKKFTIW